MFENLILNRTFYEAKLSRKEVDIERVRENNKKVNKLILEKEESERLLLDIQEYRNILKIIETAVEAENNNFKNRRLDFLNTVITGSIAEFFPQLGLQANVTCDFSRKSKAKMTLIDSEGHVGTPKIGQGKLMQYLVSFAACCGITKGLGFNNIFIDEAFGAAAVSLLPTIGEAVQRIVKDGTQVVLVSQNPALYQDLPVHEIQLSTDLVHMRVTLKEFDKIGGCCD